ncbi:putative 2-hydroxyacid dehydrogenase UNK4.10 [Mycena kentingensis (nom. inval.)]|nr:putative 2-hydroxyacid dehydrogenase UNK4.10 [Mycena kentingensis (nom. inval.)]
MLFRLCRCLFALYTLAAVSYTTHFFIVAPLRSALSFIVTRPIPQLPGWPHVLHRRADEFVIADADHAIDLDALSQDDIVYWRSSDFTRQHGLGHEAPIAMPESLFLSKAFANSMKPSKIVPFFYRANSIFQKEDITITTLVTSNRFQVFARLVERYSGPISVTIHVKNTTKHVHELLDSLHALYLSSPKMATNVDVHLVIDAFDRQFNTWRNIARFFARTDFVMMLDIDFFPCTDFRGAILDSPAVMDKLRSGTAALVIPAFEYPVYQDGVDPSRFPRSKASLAPLVRDGKIGMFHASWAPGHSSTDYDRFMAAPEGEVYQVTGYQSAYEPYVVLKRDGPPWCDERFIGYGGEQGSVSVRDNHLYEETARRTERKYNRRIYSEFKEEACVRYLRMYGEEEERGRNARKESTRLACPLHGSLYPHRDIVWAADDVKTLLEPISQVITYDDNSRAEFLKNCKPGGKYDGVVGIFRDNTSADRIGIFDKQLIDGFPASLKWIAHNGAGYDQIDVHAAKAKGITVSNTPGAVDDASATTALYLLISAVRQYSLSERTLREGKWKPKGTNARAHDITGRTVAILGLGGIGLRLAELVHAFPMRVIYHSRNKVAHAPGWCEYFPDVEAMLKEADVLSVHVPLRPDTVGLVGEKWIRLLKPGSVIVNTARGKVIDEDAMIRALEDGHLASVGLDVYPNEPEVNPRLLEFPNITLLPHMGTENQDTQRKMEVRALTNLRDFIVEGKGKDVVVEMK